MQGGFASAYSGSVGLGKDKSCENFARIDDDKTTLKESTGGASAESSTDWRTRALGLPAYDHSPLQLGSLAHLDGSTYSLYEQRVTETTQQDGDDPWATNTQQEPANNFTSTAPVLGQHPEIDSEAWRPQGNLLGTLYEYAHGAAAVTRVDGTDDGRVMVTTGNDGTIKIWNAAQIEKDVAVHSLRTFRLPDADSAGGPDSAWSFRPALRTMRNNKSFLVGSDRGNVYLYRLEAGRLATAPAPVLHNGAHSGRGTITALDHFDTDLESMVIYAAAGLAILII